MKKASLTSCYSIRLVNWIRSGRHHSASIDPSIVLWVPPERIMLCKKVPIKGKYDRMFSQVIGGEWVKELGNFRSHPIYQYLYRRVTDSCHIEDDPWFLHCRRMIETKGHFWHGCSTLKDLHMRTSNILNIYENVLHNGYTSPPEVIKLHPGRAPHSFNSQVKVAITPSGTYAYVTGAHRTAIALLAGVDYIPVSVVVRHATWQAFRNLIKETKDGSLPIKPHQDLLSATL